MLLRISKRVSNRSFLLHNQLKAFNSSLNRTPKGLNTKLLFEEMGPKNQKFEQKIEMIKQQEPGFTHLFDYNIERLSELPFFLDSFEPVVESGKVKTTID